MSRVIVVIGPGQIGQAIARRVGVAKHVLLADMREENANAAAEVLGNAGYEVSWTLAPDHAGDRRWSLEASVAARSGVVVHAPELVRAALLDR